MMQGGVAATNCHARYHSLILTEFHSKVAVPGRVNQPVMDKIVSITPSVYEGIGIATAERNPTFPICSDLQLIVSGLDLNSLAGGGIDPFALQLMSAHTIAT